MKSFAELNGRIGKEQEEAIVDGYSLFIIYQVSTAISSQKVAVKWLTLEDVYRFLVTIRKASDEVSVFQ